MLHSQEHPLVAIKCMTYNHELYISRCLEGFVIQETDFPFIAIVHDDASTDNTANIIREYAEIYPDIIKPIYESENQYTKHDGSIRKIMENAIPESVKYIAICEGDDYWIDPHKLQKQVDFLEQHLDYALSYTYYKINRNDTVIDAPTRKRPSGQVFKNLILRNFIVTNTVVCRYDLYLKAKNNIRSYSQSWVMGDYPLWLELSFLGGKFEYLSDATSVYRVLEESASHSTQIDKIIKFNKSVKDIQKFYAHKFGLNMDDEIELNYNSGMYQYCLEHNYDKIEPYRNFFLELNKGSSCRSKLFKFTAKYRTFEKMLKFLLKNTIYLKIYSLIK